MLHKLQVPCGKKAAMQAQASCWRSTPDGVGRGAEMSCVEEHEQELSS